MRLDFVWISSNNSASTSLHILSPSLLLLNFERVIPGEELGQVDTVSQSQRILVAEDLHQNSDQQRSVCTLIATLSDEVIDLSNYFVKRSLLIFTNGCAKMHCIAVRKTPLPNFTIN